jgi:hypothetical protein
MASALPLYVRMIDGYLPARSEWGKKSVENLVEKDGGMALIPDVMVPVLDLLPNTPITQRIHRVLGLRGEFRVQREEEDAATTDYNLHA